MRTIDKLEYIELKLYMYDFTCQKCNRILTSYYEKHKSGKIKKWWNKKHIKTEEKEIVCSDCFYQNSISELDKRKKTLKDFQIMELNLYSIIKNYKVDKNINYEILYTIIKELWNKEIGDFLNKSPYDSFLKTSYWKSVRIILYGFNKGICSSCNKNTNYEFQVHHKTYINRGHEINNNFYDLELLCNNCHKEKHKKNG